VNRLTIVRFARLICLASLVVGLLAGCTTGTVPVYRIGLMLPLSGRYRDTGVDVFFATRMALLNALAADPAVVAVVGHWRPETTQAAQPAYQAAGLPLITAEAAAEAAASADTYTLNIRPEVWQATIDAYLSEASIDDAAVFPQAPDLGVTEAARLALNSDAGLRLGGFDWGLAQFRDLIRAADQAPSGELWFLTHAGWPQELAGAEAFRGAILNSDIGNAVEPGPISALAHDAVAVALAAINRAHSDGLVSRETVSEAIGSITVTGWTGDITFDGDGYRLQAPLYLYRWGETDAPVLLERLQ